MLSSTPPPALVAPSTPSSASPSATSAPHPTSPPSTLEKFENHILEGRDFVPSTSVLRFLPLVHTLTLPETTSLPPFPPYTRNLDTLLQRRDDIIAAAATLRPLPLLSPQDYHTHFAQLLTLELCERAFEVTGYDIHGAVLIPDANGHVTFKVPGVTDGKPFLLPGSLVRLRRNTVDAFKAATAAPNFRASLQQCMMSMTQAPLNPHFPALLASMQAQLQRDLQTIMQGQDPALLASWSLDNVEWFLQQQRMLLGELELQGRVVSIVREDVTVKLPTRFLPKSCTTCTSIAQGNGEGAGARLEAAILVSNCGHLALCRAHAGATPVCGYCHLHPMYHPRGLLAAQSPGGLIELWGNTPPTLLYDAFTVRFEEAGQAASIDLCLAFLARHRNAVKGWEARLFPQLSHVLPTMVAPGSGEGEGEVLPQDAWLRLVLTRASAKGVAADEWRGGGGGEGKGGGSGGSGGGAATPPPALLLQAIKKDGEAHAAALKGEAPYRSLPKDPALLQALIHPVRHFIDTHLSASQKATVQAIVLGAFGTTPYLLLGPAGCGKTRVIAECVLQLVARGKRVLVCGPGEPQTDNVLTVLMKTSEGVVKALAPPPLPTPSPGAKKPQEVLQRHKSPFLRVSPPHRLVDALDKGLHSSSVFAPGGGNFRWPTPSEVHDCSVMAVALPTIPLLPIKLLGGSIMHASDLNPAPPTGTVSVSPSYDSSDSGGGEGAASSPFSPVTLPPFDYIFMDESAQALEPEALMAFLYATPSTRIILAGDPRQLGCAVRSSEAQSKGLGVSLMERLLGGRLQVGGSAMGVEAPSTESATAAASTATSATTASAAGKQHGSYLTAATSAPKPKPATEKPPPQKQQQQQQQQYPSHPPTTHTLLCDVVRDALCTTREEMWKSMVALKAARVPSSTSPTTTAPAPASAPAPSFLLSLSAQDKEETTQAVAQARAEAEALVSGDLQSVYKDAKAWMVSILAGIERQMGEWVGEGVRSRVGEDHDPLNFLLSSTLTGNFRCSQAILRLPSILFYSGIPLVSSVPMREQEGGFGKWGLMRFARKAAPPTQAPYPIMVVGVKGKERSMGGGGVLSSLVNDSEVEALVFAIRTLMSQSQLNPHDSPHEKLLAAVGSSSSSSGDGVPTLLPFAAFKAPTADQEPLPVTQADIAVIAPNRPQVVVIRTALRSVGLYDINVGTPDVLQGKERSVVFISTVFSAHFGPNVMNKRVAQVAAQEEVWRREGLGVGGGGGGGVGGGGISPSTAPLFSSNSILPAGLFYNPRSLNVAMTRAQHLLVFVGDPDIYAMDPSFLTILRESVHNKTFVSFDEGVRVPKVGRQVGLGL